VVERFELSLPQDEREKPPRKEKGREETNVLIVVRSVISLATVRRVEVMVVAVNMVAIITVVLHLHVVVVPFEVEAGVEDGVEVGVVLGPVVERRIADEVRCDLDPVPVRLVVVRGL